MKLLGFDDRGKVRLSMKIVDQTTGHESRAPRASLKSSSVLSVRRAVIASVAAASAADARRAKD